MFIQRHLQQLSLSASLILTSLLSPSAIADKIALPEDLPALERPKQAELSELSHTTGLKAGQQVPEFSTLRATQAAEASKTMTWSELKGEAPLLVIFYRGGWCPYCNRQIRELTEAYGEFKQRHITPVLISADKVEGAALAQATYEIPFPVLSDADLAAHDAFKVTMELPENLVEIYKDYGITLEDWNGKGHRKFALSSAFLVDASGTVRWSHISPDYKTRPSIEQLLHVIDQRQR